MPPLTLYQGAVETVHESFATDTTFLWFDNTHFLHGVRVFVHSLSCEWTTIDVSQPVGKMQCAHPTNAQVRAKYPQLSGVLPDCHAF